MTHFYKKNISILNIPKSVRWFLIGSLCYSLAMTLVKFLSPNIASTTLVFIRLLFGTLFLVPTVIKAGAQKLKTKRFPLHCLRIFFTCLAMSCTYYAYSHLPLALATSAGFTGPLITTLFSIVFLRDRVSFQRWIILLIGYIGVLVAVHPGAAPFDPAILVALAASVFASISILLVKKLVATESPTQMLFYSTLGCLIIIGSIVVWRWHTPSIENLALLFVISALNLFAQYCNLRAIQLTSPSRLAPFEYSRFVFALPLGILLLGEQPTLRSLVASVIIIVATAYLTFLTNKKGAQHPKNSS